jgi:RNA polymerase-binding transcription factor DksA
MRSGETAAMAKARVRLIQLRNEYQQRVAAIHAHARDPLEADSSEQAAQLGNVAVVTALEGEATEELAAIDAALARLDAGDYGTCVTCGARISAGRLQARPASAECVACAEAHERR